MLMRKLHADSQNEPANMGRGAYDTTGIPKTQLDMIGCIQPARLRGMLPPKDQIDLNRHLLSQHQSK